jgi:hypothetical protein
MIAGGHSQSDESQVITRLAKECLAPKTFIEFGFHPIEFNCISLARRPDWSGMLIDGNSRQIEDARALLPKRLDIVEAFLTLDNLEFVERRFPALGVLSIDVDGNDYWFLDRLICVQPTIISVEYNASFGTRPITVPYDPAYKRSEKHSSGWYHGASITALSKLAASRGYGLAAVSSGGMNVFFTKSGKLNPEASWRTNVLRDQWSRTTADQQWDRIKDLEYVEV